MWNTKKNVLLRKRFKA